MSAQTIKILIAGALFLHGVFHIIAGALFGLGVFHTLGYSPPASSWLFPKLPALFAYVVWTLAAVGFLLSFLSFLGIVLPTDIWRSLAVVFAVVSLLGLGIFWGNWPMFNTIGALAMNITVLVTQLWIDWPPFEMFGY
jgi:hypothetical protein